MNVKRADLRVELLERRDQPTLLIGTWNVDIADLGYRPPGFEPALAAMGSEYAYYGSPQAPDILTVTKTRSNAPSGTNADTDYLTQLLNDAYGGGYDHGTLNGASTGGGTEGVIFNTQTVELLQETAVGTPSTTGPARQELRYLFRPVGYDDGSADFYVYVGHYKSGTTTTDKNRRNVEAQQVRADADALGVGAPILYTGDFNAYSSNEPAEQVLLAPGSGQAFDPTGRLGTWHDNPDMVDLESIQSFHLDNRYDLLWESAPVVDGYGLQALPWTYHSFGNNGSIPIGDTVADPNNTALAELPNQADVLAALATACSDHIPVLQEYQIVTPQAAAHRNAGAAGALLAGALSSAAPAAWDFGGHPAAIAPGAALRIDDGGYTPEAGRPSGEARGGKETWQATGSLPKLVNEAEPRAELTYERFNTGLEVDGGDPG
jgi:hypothetical protein